MKTANLVSDLNLLHLLADGIVARLNSTFFLPEGYVAAKLCAGNVRIYKGKVDYLSDSVCQVQVLLVDGKVRINPIVNDAKHETFVREICYYLAQ